LGDATGPITQEDCAVRSQGDVGEGRTRVGPSRAYAEDAASPVPAVDLIAQVAVDRPAPVRSIYTLRRHDVEVLPTQRPSAAVVLGHARQGPVADPDVVVAI